MSDTKILGVQTAGAVNHLGVGDPSCDLVIAWTFLDAISRADFRAAMSYDPATRDRVRSWAIWKALLTLTHRDANPPEVNKARQVISNILADHSRAHRLTE